MVVLREKAENHKVHSEKLLFIMWRALLSFPGIYKGYQNTLLFVVLTHKLILLDTSHNGKKRDA